jgi:DNA polymerase III delta prime subunit
MVLQTAQGDYPHLLFYGPTGIGKKRLIMALLQEMYGATAEKVPFCYSLTLRLFSCRHAVNNGF